MSDVIIRCPKRAPLTDCARHEQRRAQTAQGTAELRRAQTAQDTNDNGGLFRSCRLCLAPLVSCAVCALRSL